MTSYINHHQTIKIVGGNAVVDAHSWEDHTRRALTWQYGQPRADRIMAGTDPNTQSDVAAWNRLGETKGEVA